MIQQANDVAAARVAAGPGLWVGSRYRNLLLPRQRDGSLFYEACARFTAAACTGDGSNSRIENASAVAIANPATNPSRDRIPRASGYADQSGRTIKGANFVQAESAANTPRRHDDVTKKKPQTSSEKPPMR